MKKWILLVLAVLMSIFFSACSMHYLGDTLMEDDISYYYADKGNKAFAATFYYDGTNHVITIPDEVQGYKVVGLGGYFGRGVPAPYTTEILDTAFEAMDLRAYANHPPLADGEITIFVDLTLKLGANMADVNAYETWTLFEKDGVTYAVIPIIHIDCAEDNRTFYSRDGRLYRKDDDSLVEGFIYDRSEVTVSENDI